MLYVSVDLHQVVHSTTPLKPHKYLSGIANCLYISVYHFHPFRYTVHSVLFFFLEIVDVRQWPLGRGGGVVMRHVELNDRYLRSHGKIGDYGQSTFP